MKETKTNRDRDGMVEGQKEKREEKYKKTTTDRVRDMERRRE